MECQKVIIDCDAGSDDAVAIAMMVAAHRQKKVEILGITCVTGNTHVDNVVNNVFRTLQVCDALDIPVFKGADSALLSTSKNIKEMSDNHSFHGADGFGDVFTDKPNISKLKEEHAVCALQMIAKKHCGEVTILCLAPLTNIALAIKMYPDFPNSVKKFFIMGGNTSAIGNTTSHAEFNFFADPESVHIVLHNAPKKLWLLPWEPCLKSTITFEWRDNVLGKISTPVMEFINSVEDAVYSSDKKGTYYMPCDAFVTGIFLKPDIAKDIVEHHIDIELASPKSRGMVLVDHLKSNEPNAHIVQSIDMETFKELLIFAVNPNTKNSRILL